MLRRKFAVIKFWPNVKAAEDELIERLKIAAKSLDLECIVVDPFARLVDSPHTQLTREDVDFVLSMHFTTPKRFDIFSFVTLWNPLQFYHDWGYRKYTRHLLTHDDFLSCDSASGDDHIMRSVSDDPMRDGPLFRFYPTVSEPILPPTLGDMKLCYLGINWERLSQQPGRHDGLMGLLDEARGVRIYGPKLYAGVDVWKGFASYVGPIPFDGVSVVRLISQAGISLVLSSPAHRQSEMMSCRIFESSAAGAIIICDENPFARRHFGDSLLYIDTSLPPEETYGQVQSHLDWIRSEPDKALEMARASQAIYREHFRLDTCLERIYEGLPARKQKLQCLYTPKNRDEKVCVVFLMPEFLPGILEHHIANCLCQQNVNIRGVLAVDARDAKLFGARIRSRIGESSAPIEIAPVHFVERRLDESVVRRRPLGEVLSKVLEELVQEEYVCVVAPHEKIYSDHLGSLLRKLQDSPEAGCAWSDMLREQGSGAKLQSDLCDDPDPGASADDPPIGSGRFLFRKTLIEKRFLTALPYLDTLAMHLFLGATRNVPTRRCTIVTAAPDSVDTAEPILPANLEREILMDFSPETFRAKERGKIPTSESIAPTAVSVAPTGISLAGMTREERTAFAVELAHSIPIPALLKKIAFGTYRLWLRATRAPE